VPPLPSEEALLLSQAWERVSASEELESLALIFSLTAKSLAHVGAVEGVRSPLQIELILRSLNQSSAKRLANLLQ